MQLVIALNDKTKSSLATKIDSLSSLTLFITVIHSWMSVYPYFNRMLRVRFFFTLLYTKPTVLCYRWKTITPINYLIESYPDINLINNFLLFNAKCIHSVQIFVLAFIHCTPLHHDGCNKMRGGKMRAMRRGVSVAIHTLPFILPLHLWRRLTGHKHEWVSLTQRLLPDSPCYREVLPVSSYYWSLCCWWWWALWSKAPSTPG